MNKFNLLRTVIRTLLTLKIQTLLFWSSSNAELNPTKYYIKNFCHFQRKWCYMVIYHLKKQCKRMSGRMKTNNRSNKSENGKWQITYSVMCLPLWYFGILIKFISLSFLTQRCCGFKTRKRNTMIQSLL